MTEEKRKIVYVVHCIDTEGPLYESLDATFERLKDIFNLDFDISIKTLKKLQNKEIDLNGKEEAVANLIAPNRITFNDTWDKINKILDEITSDKFRKKYSDSFGNGWIYNWFCVDHVGYNGINPRRRSIGYHNVFNHYRQYIKLNNIQKDTIHWHYHPPAIIKDAHISGTTYLNSSNIFEILSRKIIDYMWFPAAYRPGFHVERPDSHWFLEQWIPFDYGNQSTNVANDQPDMATERFGDWRRAPLEWLPYHPDFYDYQKKGSCKRFITRCLNIESRDGSITIDEIRDAFILAEEKGRSLLAFTNHDIRDMRPEIDKIGNMLKKVDEEFVNVGFNFVNPIEGMRKVLGLDNLNPPNFSVEIEKKGNKAVLIIKAENEIFGPQPFLAIKTKSSQYFWENFDFKEKNVWSYTFDYNNIDISAIDKIGMASNTHSGVTEVVLLDPETNTNKRSLYNTEK